MTLQDHKMESKSKILVKDLNSALTCGICSGYLVDATSLVDCLHVFCRGCILKYFENCKTACPVCNILYKKKTQTCFRSDAQLQSLVNKIVPGLYSKEMQRREDFYRSTGVRASSSCSDDSVLEREREIQDQDEMISSMVGDKTLFFGPDDHISLSLEYYQAHLDKTPLKRQPVPFHHNLLQKSSSEDANSNLSVNVVNNSSANNVVTTKLNELSDKKCDKIKICEDVTIECKNNGDFVVSGGVDDGQKDKFESITSERHGDKRYLQCPAAVSMKHLQKFIRMKYALTGDHRVDIIYEGEVLPSYFSLMDVAYTFKWKRDSPMRFFYRIFTPMKVRPIKIINTTTTTGGKQLQIVPIKSTSNEENKTEKQPQKSATTTTQEQQQENSNKKDREKEEKQQQETERKETLLANLQLQSKNKVQNKETSNKKTVPDPNNQDCIYTYQEDDKEELKRFAEKRDREWAMQKQLDEEYSHHSTKKRKKNKHSKNESMHKKRKLHAEITSTNEKEDLKLKVKLTPHNGHKHKHHRSSSSSQFEKTNKELSSKEKLLQMRQIRHKHITEDKNVQTNIKITSLEEKDELKSVKHLIEVKDTAEEERQSKTEPPVEKIVRDDTQDKSQQKKVEPATTSKNVTAQMKVVAPTNNNSSKEWGSKVPTVQIERNEMTEKQAQKTFLKTFQSYAEKYKTTLEKIQQNNKTVDAASAASKMTPTNKPISLNNLTPRQTQFEKKIASLQQHCTIEPKIIQTSKTEKPTTITPTNNKIVSSSPYPAGFTVSKIETSSSGSIKRKIEHEDNVKDKRPSLEITLINPPKPSPTNTSNQITPKTNEVVINKNVAKRPPPPTIPLERIKKSNLKGISITPAKCDNIGALDLSKPNKSPEGNPNSIKTTEIKPVNGFNLNQALMNRQLNSATPKPLDKNSSPPEKTNPMQLSNLQMLSKVATEHPNLNKNTTNNNNNNSINNKARPQVPNLQTLKIPTIPNNNNNQTSSGIKPGSNLAKLPKLNEINKNQFRQFNPQIRNVRPNQNQNIRSIPNPSLLVRQQNQNRLNSISSIQHNDHSTNNTQNRNVNLNSKDISEKSTTSSSSALCVDTRTVEKKEISVGQ